MTATGSTIGIAGIVLLAAVAMTWSLARGTRSSEIGSLRAQIANCEERAAARRAENAGPTNAALAEKKREMTLVQELKSENEQLRRAGEMREQELASAKAAESPSGAAPPGQEPAARPGQTIDLSPGEQRDMIPGVLNLTVKTLDPTSAEIWYGGHPHHLQVGESAVISYLGRRCVLGLTEIKGGGDTQRGSFSFSVKEP